jgi:hypothetical protein
MNRKVFLRIAGGCVIVLLVVIISACNEKKDNVSTITIDPSTLFWEYDNNVAKAESQYKGKTLKITGIIKEIGKNSSNLYFIDLLDDFVRVSFKSSETNKIGNLSKGEGITVVGKCEGISDGFIQIKNSIIYEAKLSPNFKKIIKETEDHLKFVANAASKFLTVEELDRFHTIEEAKKQSYRELKMRLAQFTHENNVLYVSYLRQYDKDNLQYIIDNDFDPKTIVSPGTIMPIEDIERVALAGKIGISDLNTYITSATSMTWNGLISGFAPVFNTDGSVYCIVIVDISEDEFIQKLYQ